MQFYNYIHYNIYFFFSSRRRHTRSKRDWSSDVCSSDLLLQPRHDQAVRCGFGSAIGSGSSAERVVRNLLYRETIRSEERRVGKECRYRWSQYDYKIK